MSNELFIDIETVPDEFTLDKFTSGIEPMKAPSSMTKGALAQDLDITCEETLKKHTKESLADLWSENLGQSMAEVEALERWRKTALNGDYGNVLVIAVDSVIGAHQFSGFDETETLTDFYDYVRELGASNNNGLLKTVGHNITGFDLSFLYKRSVINGIKPPPFISMTPSKYSDYVFDTMERWAGFNKFISLDDLCDILGIEYNKEVNGSMIFDLYKDGQLPKIKEYAAEDVSRVKTIYNMMNFN